MNPLELLNKEIDNTNKALSLKKYPDGRTIPPELLKYIEYQQKYLNHLLQVLKGEKTTEYYT